MEKEYIQVGMDNAEKSTHAIYADGGIAILDNINEMPRDHNDNFRLKDVLVIIACTEGKMSICVNTKRCTVRANDFLICASNGVFNDCMVSPDFKGRIICVSHEAIRDTIRIENSMWNKAFRIKDDPVVRVSGEGTGLFAAYNALIDARTATSGRMYTREVMISMIRAMLYDILAELSEFVDPPGGGLIQQKDILFKRFVELLSSQEVKPRSVAWYSERLCVSPKYLSTVCKQVSGKTAFRWIDEFVITDIRQQLRYSGRSIKEIACHLDFPNISFFGKYVKKHTGMCPSEYQRQLREEAE